MAVVAHGPASDCAAVLEAVSAAPGAVAVFGQGLQGLADVDTAPTPSSTAAQSDAAMSNHSHSQLTSRHLSNISLGNVTNAEHRHVSCSCYTCVVVDAYHVHTLRGMGEFYMFKSEETNIISYTFTRLNKNFVDEQATQLDDNGLVIGRGIMECCVKRRQGQQAGRKCAESYMPKRKRRRRKRFPVPAPTLKSQPRPVEGVEGVGSPAGDCTDAGCAGGCSCGGTGGSGCPAARSRQRGDLPVAGWPATKEKRL